MLIAVKSKLDALGCTAALGLAEGCTDGDAAASAALAFFDGGVAELVPDMKPSQA